MEITLGSLFDGAGGFPLAGTMAGIIPKWASEIEPFPIRVTTKRFPDMKHIGNITGVDGSEIDPVDIITFGSPCQDLSVAGNRKGLAGERSGLFLEAVRVIREMREKTNGQKPEFIVWENVPGAFSSNGGEDFRTVLEEIAKIKDPGVCIPRPDNGRWAHAGEIMGDSYSIAYRVYDAQFWGVPQRRKRIYLVADLSAGRAGKIQFECDRLYGDFAQSAGTGQGTAETAGGRIEEPGRAAVAVAYGLSSKDSNAWKSSNPHSGCYEAETARTLDTRGGDATCNQGGMLIISPTTVFETHQQDLRYKPTGNKAQTVTAMYGTGSNNQPLAVTEKPAYVIGRDNVTAWEEKAQTLTRSDAPGTVVQPVYGVVSKGNGDCFLTLEKHTSLTAGCGQAGQGYPCVAQPYTIGNGQVHDLSPDDKARTINCMHDAQAVIVPQAIDTSHADDVVRITETVNCIQARDYKGGNCVFTETTKNIYPYIVRRLMPLECSRLQGYPDYWVDGLETAEPTEDEIDWWIRVFETYRKAIKPDIKPKTRNQVRKWLQHPHSDSAEYKMWGNSLAIPNAYHVLKGIAEELQTGQEQRTMYIANWSGGKDSTASIILAHEHGEPLDLIIFSEVMFDKEISGELPEHIDFVKNKAIPLFESWGYKVKILHAKLTYMDIFMREPTRGKRAGTGLKTGFPMVGRCQINRSVKCQPIEDFLKGVKKEEYIQYIGIAIDEPERLERLRGTSRISLLEKYGYTEEMAYDLCEKYELLSPTYNFTKRGGCWFCPNSRKKQLRHLRDCHPELWQKLMDLEDEPDLIGHIWNSLEKKSIHMIERQFQQEDAQMTIWDFIKE